MDLKTLLKPLKAYNKYPPKPEIKVFLILFPKLPLLRLKFYILVQLVKAGTSRSARRVIQLASLHSTSVVPSAVLFVVVTTSEVLPTPVTPSVTSLSVPSVVVPVVPLEVVTARHLHGLLNLRAENIVEGQLGDVSVRREEAHDLHEVRLQILVGVALEALLELLNRVHREGLLLGHRVVDLEHRPQDRHDVVKSLKRGQRERLDGADGQIALLPDVGDDLERGERLVLVEGECGEESDAAAHGDVSGGGGIVVELGGVLERRRRVQFVASGEGQHEDVLRIARALHLAGLDDLKCVQHVLVAFTLVQQVQQKLVADQLVEEPVELLVFEQSERRVGILEVMEESERDGAEDEVAEAHFLALRAESFDHLHQQLHVLLPGDVEHVLQILGEDQIFGIFIFHEFLHLCLETIAVADLQLHAFTRLQKSFKSDGRRRIQISG